MILCLSRWEAAMIVSAFMVLVCGCRSEPGGGEVRRAIADIREKGVGYELIGEAGETLRTGHAKAVMARVVISSVGCSVCFDDIVKVLNDSAEDTTGLMVSLVIANPDRHSAYQLRRMYGIKVPVYITGDERLQTIGRRLGTSYVFTSSPGMNIYNLRPLNSAYELERYLAASRQGGS